VELGLIIGREARYLNGVGDAVACIAGYCISHDVSEREFQLKRGGQWSKGKSCDTFNPLGPWLTTSDESPDVSKLRMKLTVNGQLKQNGSKETMIFPPAQVAHYISQFHDARARRPNLNRHTTRSGLGMKTASLS
jgi:2,4-diketo-3-deoxy-L-fuconate hydrolase